MKQKKKSNSPNEKEPFSVNKGLLIFCLALLAVIIILTVVLTTVLK